MACIVTALEADNNVRTLGEPVDNLAFTFVSPLGSDDHNIGHG
jgi:hypothetical protein